MIFRSPHPAAIVLLDADPLEDISITLRTAPVIQEGRVVDRGAPLRPSTEGDR